MERLMKAIARSVGPVGNITLILSVVIYIFAVLGIKVFGEAYTADKFGKDGVPRWNFNDFWHAFMMVFRVLCGEWIEPLWDCMRATSAAKATLFFLTVLIVGNFIVSNKIKNSKPKCSKTIRFKQTLSRHRLVKYNYLLLINSTANNELLIDQSLFPPKLYL